MSEQSVGSAYPQVAVTVDFKVKYMAVLECIVITRLKVA